MHCLFECIEWYVLKCLLSSRAKLQLASWACRRITLKILNCSDNNLLTCSLHDTHCKKFLFINWSSVWRTFYQNAHHLLHRECHGRRWGICSERFNMEAEWLTIWTKFCWTRIARSGLVNTCSRTSSVSTQVSVHPVWTESMLWEVKLLAC